MIVRPRPVPVGLILLAVLTVLGGLTAGIAASAPAAATTSDVLDPDLSVVVENWRGYSGPYHKTHEANRIAVVPSLGADDGKALQLQLNARPGFGPGRGVQIAGNNSAFRYGTFGTRMKTGNCAGQRNRPGVVTGFLIYSPDVSDSNGNGLADNAEIDVEVLCAQPEVIWMSLYTDYDEATDSPRKISRAVDLRTGRVLHNCYRGSWTGRCQPTLPGENVPAAVRAVPGFNSSEKYHSYSFNWQPDRVRFFATDDQGAAVLLWDYQGPASRIPQKPSMFLQNLWHTRNWDPLNGPARNPPQVDTSAFLDSTTVPRWSGTVPGTWARVNEDSGLRPHRWARPAQ